MFVYVCACAHERSGAHKHDTQEANEQPMQKSTNAFISCKKVSSAPTTSFCGARVTIIRNSERGVTYAEQQSKWRSAECVRVREGH